MSMEEGIRFSKGECNVSVYDGDVRRGYDDERNRAACTGLSRNGGDVMLYNPILLKANAQYRFYCDWKNIEPRDNVQFPIVMEPPSSVKIKGVQFSVGPASGGHSQRDSMNKYFKERLEQSQPEISKCSILHGFIFSF